MQVVGLFKARRHCLRLFGIHLPKQRVKIQRKLDAAFAWQYWHDDLPVKPRNSV